MAFFLNDYLDVKGINLRNRISGLFDELAKDPKLAQVFIRNPILVLQSMVLPEVPLLDEETLNASNQFLFSVLSNDKFTKWLENYQSKLIAQYNSTAKLPSKRKIIQEFAKGLIINGDPKILSDLLQISPKGFPEQQKTLVFVHDYIAIASIFIRLSIITVSQYYVIIWFWILGPSKMKLMDENQKIVTISPRELKSLSEQIVKYAKKVRAQAGKNTVEK
jgi:hypothetical protein